MSRKRQSDLTENKITERNFSMENKYKPKKMTNIIFYILIGAGALLAIIRWGSVFNVNLVFINQEIHSHISNFTLSMIFYVGIGFSWLLQGASLKKIVLLGLFIVLANFVCETIITTMNTPDIIDAIYGTAGTVVSFVFLWAMQKYGLINNDKSN